MTTVERPGAHRTVPARTVRWVRAVLVVLAGALAVLAGPLPAGSPGGPRPAVAAPTAPATAEHVVVVGVAGLRWSDLSADHTPTLARLAQRGAVGTLLVRAAPDVTCAGEGWLTLGAGRSAAVTALEDIDPDAGCDPRRPPPVEVDGDHGRVPEMATLTQLNDQLRFGAEPGNLGSQVRCASAVGPGAALAVADTSGFVDRYAASLPADPSGLLAACPLAAVDLGAVPTDDGARRREALRRLDQAVARVDVARPDRSLLLVVGVAGTDPRRAGLHVAIAEGPGFSGGWLRSPSTGRTPYLQLVDIAPTVLRVLGQPIPDNVAGAPVSRQVGDRPAGFAGTRSALVDTHQAAVARKHLVGWVLGGFGVLCGLVYAAAAVVLRRRRAGHPDGTAADRWLAVAVTGLGTFPVATFLANTVPWWRADPTLPALAGVVSLVAVGITALAVLPPWGRTASGRTAVVCAVTVLVLLVDIVTGARLQLNSILGYTALEAGRFVGVGNVTFALLGAASLLLTAILAGGRGPRAGLAVVAAVAVPVIVVEGAPGWGTDVGGILTLVPAFGVLALLVAGLRVTTGRALAVLGAGAGLVTTAAVVDYLRPEDERSHFGRFVGTVLDGGAATTVVRKLRANAEMLFAGPHTVAAALLLVGAAVAVFRPPAVLRVAYRNHPGLRTGLRVVVVLAALGFAANDSGIAVPVSAALIALPAAVAACLRPAPPSRAALAAAGTDRHDQGDGAAPSDTPADTADGTTTDAAGDGAHDGADDGRRSRTGTARPDTPASAAGATADVLP